MATTFLPLPPAPTAWPETAILTGHLAPSSLAKYQQAQRAYLAFCATPALAHAPGAAHSAEPPHH